MIRHYLSLCLSKTTRASVTTPEFIMPRSSPSDPDCKCPNVALVPVRKGYLLHSVMNCKSDVNGSIALPVNEINILVRLQLTLTLSHHPSRPPVRLLLALSVLCSRPRGSHPASRPLIYLINRLHRPTATNLFLILFLLSLNTSSIEQHSILPCPSLTPSPGQSPGSRPSRETGL